MTADTETIREGREKLRRAAEDGERLYRVRMHGPNGESVADGNRIDGILTLELMDALGYVDTLLTALGRVEERERALTEALRRIDFTAGNILRVVNFAKDDAETLAGVTFVNATDIRSFARAALFAASVAAGSGEE